MEALIPWLTPALIVALFAWVRADMRSLRQELHQGLAGLRQELAGLRQELRQELHQGLAGLRQEMRQELAGLRQELAGLRQELADLRQQVGELRERMAKLEGSLEGFLAGRRDRNVAQAR